MGIQSAEEQETTRYIEYLQRQLLREGTEEIIRGQQRWFEQNREAIATQYQELMKSSGGLAHQLHKAVLSHQDQTEFDFFFSEKIFSPLLEKTLHYLEEAGISPKGPIRFANSPNVEASPAVRPSSDVHLLFAGPGTYAFCNYWAKIFSTALHEVSQLQLKELNPQKILEHLGSKSILLDATLLSIRYALTDSLIGFGKLKQDKELHALRVLLVNAMEIFIVAHEIAHCVQHENHPNTGGIPPGTLPRESEIECDAVGLAVCTAYGAEEDNVFAFHFLGPLLFFYAIHLSERVKAILTGTQANSGDSHPSIQERIKFVFEFAQAANVGPDVIRNMKESLEIAMVIGSYVQASLSEISQQTTELTNA